MKNSHINKIIKEEIHQMIREEEYFQEKLPDDIKRLSKKYEGRNVVWYGDPDQMIVVHKDNVYGMWGNIYDQSKLKYVKDMIRNSEDKIEFECSYALGGIINFTEVREHQESFAGGSFYTDYDGHDEPYTTGDSDLDEYLGKEIDEIEFYDYAEEDETKEFMENHRFDLVNNKIKLSELKSLIENLPSYEVDEYYLDTFLEFEENLKNAVDTNQGDLGNFNVQLRDGHHRVMGAIAAGEEYVCVNLEKNHIIKYKGHYEKV